MKLQKRLAGEILKCGKKRIKLDQSKIVEIKEAITKVDVKKLINSGVIKLKPKRGTSHVRALKRKRQKQKGRQKGYGSRKGKRSARVDEKRVWINAVRAQRRFLAKLKQKQTVSNKTFRKLYKKSHGGFFRGVNHIKLYITENQLWNK